MNVTQDELLAQLTKLEGLAAEVRRLAAEGSKAVIEDKSSDSLKSLELEDSHNSPYEAELTEVIATGLKVKYPLGLPATTRGIYYTLANSIASYISSVYYLTHPIGPDSHKRNIDLLNKKLFTLETICQDESTYISDALVDSLKDKIDSEEAAKVCKQLILRIIA